MLFVVGDDAVLASPVVVQAVHEAQAHRNSTQNQIPQPVWELRRALTSVAGTPESEQRWMVCGCSRPISGEELLDDQRRQLQQFLCRVTSLEVFPDPLVLIVSV
jgi:hypothetical protein